MHFVSRHFRTSHDLQPTGVLLRALTIAWTLVCGSLVLAPGCASAQTPPPSEGRIKPAAAPAEPQWASLSAGQRKELEPLSGIWDSMGEGRKRKWLTIANSAPSLAEAERAKLHNRMEEWAKLSRKDRELARLNFAQSKNLNKDDRVADWEAYNALSDEQRRRLAEKARPKPGGAALALKPPAPGKLIHVPVTRNTPPAQREAIAKKPLVNRTTLLPVRTAPGADAAQTAKP